MGYFNSQEYNKAEVLFDKLYKQRNTKYYFDYYLECLIFQEKYDDARKRIKKEMRKNPNDLTFYIDLGYLEKKQGNNSEAQKQFQHVLDKIEGNRSLIINIGNSFVRKKEFDWAEKVYKKGNDLLDNIFLQYLANIYASQRKHEQMIETYLDYVGSDYSKISTVQNVFASNMQYDVNNEFANALQRSLLKRIQNNRNDVYEELLIWYYVEKTEFFNAFIYAKALDKRNKENGVRVFRIGKKAATNEDFTTANKAFNYVVDKGENYPYFDKAKFALLEVLYYQVENGEITSDDEISNLENNYLSVINKNGISEETVDLIVDLAHLQAFYLGKHQEAIDLLQDAMQSSGVQDFKATFMIELGDIYVFAEMPWEAVLIFAKVEKNFSNLELTDDAKFKKAKVYFYLGEFDWAKSQWDVLKGSPSKLISNDAIYWSQFISENLSEDSLQLAMKKYARADLYFYQKKYPKTISTADSIILNFSSEPIISSVYYLKYQVYVATGEFQKAAMNLETIVGQYSYAMWTDKALFELAELYENQLNNKEKATESYKKLLFEFEGSLYTDQARKKYRELINE